jgi:division protein CdvB (Snf7/Vps24/ESCRT-III family)
MVLSWRFWKLGEDKPLRDRIIESIKSIEFHKRELDNIKRRLEARREKLFNLTVKALEDKDKVRAKVYATEHAELKRVIKVVTISELALTQIAIRLESICDTGDVIVQVSAAFKVVKKIGEELSSIMPQLETTMKEVNDVLVETMSSLQQITPESPITLDLSGGQEILESAKKYVEEKVSSLEEPLPESLEGEYSLDKIQNVALLASGDNEEEPFKATLLNAPRPTPEQAILDNRVLEFIKANGSYNVVEIASRLGVPVDKVEQSIFRLAAAGKIHVEEVG